MAMEVMTPSTLPLPFPPNGLHGQNMTTVDEFAELEKIVKLRDIIYGDKHPRFKPPHSTNPTFFQKIQNSTNSSPSTVVTENTRTYVPPSPRVPRPIITTGKSTSVKSQSLVDPQISDVLLAKSDVLIKAENNLKRDRIERELKQQLENKINEDRLGSDGRFKDVDGQDLDVEDILARAQALVSDFGAESNTLSRFPFRKKRSLDDATSDNASVNQLQYEDKSFTNLDKETEHGEQSSVDHDMMEIDRTGPNAVRMSLGNGGVITQEKEKALNAWSNPNSTLSRPAGNGRPGTPQMQHIPRVGMNADRERLPPSPKEIITPLNRGNDTLALARQADVREGATPRSPMQVPRYSAIRTEEPVAPQPVRAATAVTRLAAQDLIIDLRDDEVERPREAAYLESRRSPLIKYEPGTRPQSVVGLSRPSVSPNRHAIRVEKHPSSLYEYPEAPRYHYPHFLPPTHVHPAYELYYRTQYAYPPPPPPPPISEYGSRSYGGGYPSPRYPIYEDYNRLYHRLLPHVIPVHPTPPQPRSPEPLRHSSRALERRPISPEIHRRRHSSRSISPGRALEGALVVRPIVERSVSQAPSLLSSAHRDYYERQHAPPPPGHFVDPYHPAYYVPYPPPPERPVYYDERAYYAAPPRPLRPSPHFLAELPPPPPREIREGSVIPRGLVVASYRDRDYYYPPSSPMAPPPRPYAAFDYREYREPPRDVVQESLSRSLRPDGIGMREGDLTRSLSLRPESIRNAYPVPGNPPSVSSVSYRAMSTRPETTREAYRVEERPYMRGANNVASRDGDNESQSRDRVARDAEDARRYREAEDQRRYRDLEESRQYARVEERSRNPPASYHEQRYSPRR